MIDHIMKEMESSIKTFLGNNIPYKANRFNHPHILWIEPSLHTKYNDNDLRMKFIKSLHIAARSEGRDRTIVLPLKQHWDDNADLYVFNTGATNQHGFTSLTRAIDATIRFADTRVMRNYGIPFAQIFQKEKIQKEANIRLADFNKKATQATKDRRMMNSAAKYASTVPTDSMLLRKKTGK